MKITTYISQPACFPQCGLQWSFHKLTIHIWLLACMHTRACTHTHCQALKGLFLELPPIGLVLALCISSTHCSDVSKFPPNVLHNRHNHCNIHVKQNQSPWMWRQYIIPNIQTLTCYTAQQPKEEEWPINNSLKNLKSYTKLIIIRITCLYF
jgi:hypothetical protein